jgi:riboflavin synthase
MFTGLIESVGHVERVLGARDGRTIRVATPLGAELRPGDSVAVNGVCLTATAVDASGFEATISPETRRITTLGEVTPGRSVNLERPLRADARLGGHFVLGHVDAVGVVVSFTPDGECYALDVEYPAVVAPYLVHKGSIAIDGISLTIASLSGARLGVQIVPFTAAHTTLATARAGDRVNLEADVLGKYVAAMLNTAGRTPFTRGTPED